MTMKNAFTYWQHLKQRSKQFKQLSKRTVTATLLAEPLLLQWNTAAIVSLLGH